MKNPVTKHSNSKQWKIYIVSILLQVWAWILSKLTGREITHGFYYSDSQKEIIKLNDDFTMFSEMPEPKYTNTFNGKEYTEMRGLEHGWCNWKESRLIGLGSIVDVRWDE